MEGQLKLKNAKVLLVGTGGLGAPLGLYLAAAGIGRIGLVDFDVVDFTESAAAGDPRHQGRRPQEARFGGGTMQDINPYRADRQARSRADERERARHPEGLRHGRRRHGQFPDALSGERCVRAAEEAERLRLDFPVRRPGDGLRVPRAARAIAACIRSRHLRVWFRAAPRAACWAFCRA